MGNQTDHRQDDHTHTLTRVDEKAKKKTVMIGVALAATTLATASVSNGELGGGWRVEGGVVIHYRAEGAK